ncbi:MAG: hypothetical protein ACYSWP_01245 [Planctomycetota bacterium]|jgi:hypothetical protein
MSENKNVIQNIISLHNIILSQSKRHINSEGIEQLNRFVSDLKSVGLIEGMALNGKKGRYFLIDGHSWEKACQRLGESAEPSFIAWDETAFFEFLKSQFMSTGKKRVAKKSKSKQRD